MTAGAATIDSRLASVRHDIARACDDAGRATGSVALVAVSKTFGADAIEPVIRAGQRVFGENRVQEAKAKWPALRDRHPGIELHLIGPLQSNKAREAVALFDAIHSLDRPSLAEALAKEIARVGRAPLLFVEINTGGELQKAGVLPEAADDFLKDCRDKYGLTVAGLMCLPPADEPPAPHFALTAKIARRNELNSAFNGDERGLPGGHRHGFNPCPGRNRDFRRARLVLNIDSRSWQQAARQASQVRHPQRAKPPGRVAPSPSRLLARMPERPSATGMVQWPSVRIPWVGRLGRARTRTAGAVHRAFCPMARILLDPPSVLSINCRLLFLTRMLYFAQRRRSRGSLPGRSS